ncbi:hypothetical protein [Dyadobacter sp. 32]|uniref:hypothetical protein n=1 Tax=Dyadobacter sp. 32 TaxID=538966 RepID=UPI0011EBCD4A
MKHDPHSLTSLIRDDEFIAWVLNPDAVNEQQWRHFLDENPAKFKTVQSAREYVMILARDTGRHLPSVGQSEKMWQVVDASTKTNDPDRPGWNSG